MPLYSVTYQTKKSGRSKTATKTVRAVGPTHANQLMFKWASEILKKFIKIIFIKEL